MSVPHPQILEQADLWVSGVDGYHTYRIPALAVTPRGTLLAFCEGRRDSASDSGKIDLLLRRSHDGGRTWTGTTVLAADGNDTCGNPAPVVDRTTGTVWLPFCKNRGDGPEGAIVEGKAPRTVWLTHSRDDGITWATPREITASVKPPDWSWYATGPGHGIQLRHGRLLVPCDHIVFRDGDRRDPIHSHIIFSDDGGGTWQTGGSADAATDESTAFETADGWLYLNCRTHAPRPDGGNYRAVAWSRDAGATLSPIVHDAALPEPCCAGSVCRLTDAQAHDRNRVVLSNPGTRTGRRLMTVRLSYDECRTWPVARVLHDGAAAYSDLVVTPDLRIGCLYERGADRWPYERITFARFDLAWLTDGADRGTPTGATA